MANVTQQQHDDVSEPSNHVSVTVSHHFDMHDMLISDDDIVSTMTSVHYSAL